MLTEPTRMGTSARRSGGLAWSQRLANVIARTTEASTTRARCAESTLPATVAFGQTASAFSGLPPVVQNSSQASSRGNAMSANIPMTTRSNLSMIRPSGKARRKATKTTTQASLIQIPAVNRVDACAWLRICATR